MFDNQLFVEVDGYQWIKCPLCKKDRLFQTAEGVSKHLLHHHQQWWMVGWNEPPQPKFITDKDFHEKVS